MKPKSAIIAAAALLFAVPPAQAIVGGATPSTEGIGRSVLTLIGSRGNFCSATLLAPKLALTAAHCVPAGAIYKLVEYDADQKPHLSDVKQVAVHPAFDMRAMLAHRATADVALLQLESPAKGKVPGMLAVPKLPIVPGGKFTIAGIGVTARGDGRSGGTIRSAELVATGKPGTLQIRLVDPVTSGIRDGLGACTGDSGAPVFEEQGAVLVIVGVVSWSTGPNGSAGCGGLTGVTPLTLYRDWILETTRNWGFVLRN